MEELWISIGLSVLFSVVKNPAKVLKIRFALVKLRDALNSLPLGEKGSPAPDELHAAVAKGGF